MRFKDFCKNFTYIDGCDNMMTNCMSIYYNVQLVLDGYRLSFMIQPVDYKYSYSYTIIMTNLLKSYDIINTRCHSQGTLIFLKKNIKLINSIIDSENDEYALGRVLSYPCYKHTWNNMFIRLSVRDKYGVHELMTNWYNDDGDILFKKKVNKWGKHLMNRYHCKVYTTLVL